LREKLVAELVEHREIDQALGDHAGHEHSVSLFESQHIDASHAITLHPLRALHLETNGPRVGAP
jgi:hypothetical protein